MTERLRTRFVVIGTGVAGLHAAWRASAHGDVTIVYLKAGRPTRIDAALKSAFIALQ